MMVSSRLPHRTSTLGTFLIILNVLFSVQPITGDALKTWRTEGDDTVHEQLGQAHFPEIQYNDYVSRAQYSELRTFPTMGLDSIYNFTHSLFKFLHPKNTSYMLPDYVVHNNSAFNIGNKFEQNNWKDLLDQNLLLAILWILPLCFLAIIMPFVAVIYCCFCCWRCKQTCEPCTKISHSRRLLCSTLLGLLTLLLLLAFILALLSLKQMSRDNQYTKERIRLASRNTCTYLSDVSKHLRHLMINNYKKFSDHIEGELSQAHNHVLLDLSDSCGANALTELERILRNMAASLREFKKLDGTEKYLRFIGSVYRDGLRGTKRNIHFAMVTQCQLDVCSRNMQKYQRLDTSQCLHMDDMPNTTVFLKPIENAIEEDLAAIAGKGIQRLGKVQVQIDNAIAPIREPIMLTVEKSGSNLYHEYVHLNDLIDEIISHIHLRALNSLDTFNDITERFGADRLVYASIACIMIFLIIMTLIFGLLLGLCARQSNTGSNCLVAAVIMIFCVFTFITIMGLFYYVLGMVTYQAVCRRLNNLNDTGESRPVGRIGACGRDQHIYDFLKENQLYDVERVMTNSSKGPIDVDDIRWKKWEGDLSDFTILSLNEITLINRTLIDLFPYMGKTYTKDICKNLRTPPIDVHFPDQFSAFIKSHIYDVGDGCNGRLFAACTNAHNTMIDVLRILDLEPSILRSIDAIHELVRKIDALILGRDRNFGETLEELLLGIRRCETFIEHRGEHYINTIGQNLTESLKERINEFRIFTQSRIVSNVGHCGPLIYHLDRGTRSACHQLIDPINGFWIGLLLSSLLFLPLLFVAHYLICPYRSHRVKLPVVYLVRNNGCPTCTGSPYVPPPVVICSGGQERDWDVIEVETVDSKSKQD